MVVGEESKSPANSYRFTRAIFGIVQSPFFLNGTAKIHLERSLSLHQSQEEQIRDITENIQMDGIITGGAITKEEIQLKEIAKATLKDVGFKLQKWKSNIPKLKNESLVSSVDAEQANAKRQLEYDTYDTKILVGVIWDKKRDEIGVTIPAAQTKEE